MSYCCCVCQQLIYDLMVYECDSRYFHKQCLKCQVCALNVQPERNDKLYAINGLLVCRQDYQQLKSACRVCGQRIDANDYRFQTRDSQLIHVKCMTCQSCRQSLQSGDQYVLSSQDNRLLCHKCAHFVPPIASQPTPPPPPHANGSGGGRRGRKRATNH